VKRFGKRLPFYHVSGEYAMVKSAAEKGLLDERAAIFEIMTALKRAGADIIITYWARDLAQWCGVITPKVKRRRIRGKTTRVRMGTGRRGFPRAQWK